MSGDERILRGVAVSPGIAIGRALTAIDPLLVMFQFKLEPEQTKGEVKRFLHSVERSRKQLEGVRSRLRALIGRDSAILIDAHLLMLQDRMLIDRIVEKIELDRVNAEWAIQQVSDTILEAYDRVHDDYLRERRGDLEDIVRRLLHNLNGGHAPSLKTLRHDTILVGKVIPPSTLIELRSAKLVGLAAETGSPLSHSAIMARSLEIPAVMGIENLSSATGSAELLIVDGDGGILVSSPSEATLDDYRSRFKEDRKSRRRIFRTVQEPCVTEDGMPIALGANVNFREEVKAALAYGCESIDLYRTEFDFFRDHEEPEDALVSGYASVLQTAKSIPVTFRTIDIGIDQECLDGSVSGGRGLRFSQERPDIFRKQLRAIYRASVHGRARIVLPFVSNADELKWALTVLRDVRRDLDRRGVPFDSSIPVGAMIETPAAAHTCDLIAPRVDFFCLGTNDLIQYYLAFDRTDKSAMHFYNPFHPAILRCLRHVVSLVEPAGKRVVVCGEMAADPASAAVLLGLGFRDLSVNISAYPRIKKLIRSVSLEHLRELVGHLIKMKSRKQVEQQVRSALAPRIEIL